MYTTSNPASPLVAAGFSAETVCPRNKQYTHLLYLLATHTVVHDLWVPCQYLMNMNQCMPRPEPAQTLASPPLHCSHLPRIANYRVCPRSSRPHVQVAALGCPRCIARRSPRSQSTSSRRRLIPTHRHGRSPQSVIYRFPTIQQSASSLRMAASPTTVTVTTVLVASLGQLATLCQRHEAFDGSSFQMSAEV